MSTKPSFDCIENQQGSQGGAWLGESKYWKMNKLNKPENSRFGEREREPNLWSGATRAEKSLLIGNSALRPRYLMNTECTSYYHHTLKLISFLCFFNLLSLSFRSCSYIELSTDSLRVTFLRCVHRVGNIFQCKLSRFKGAVEVIKKTTGSMAPSRSYSQREHRRITSKFRGKFRKMRNRCELIVFSLSTDHAQDFSLQRGIFCCKIYCAISIQSSCLRKQLIERSILFSFTFSIWLITSIKEQVQLSLFLTDTEIRFIVHAKFCLMWNTWTGSLFFLTILSILPGL